MMTKYPTPHDFHGSPSQSTTPPSSLPDTKKNQCDDVEKPIDRFFWREQILSQPRAFFSSNHYIVYSALYS